MKEIMEMSVEELREELKKVRSGKDGRKEQVIGLLQNERMSIKDLAAEIGITERNVSSQLSYLRKDGWLLGKDSKGRIFIEEE